MKSKYQFFTPCYINGVFVDDQETLREHYKRQKTAHELGSAFDKIAALAGNTSGAASSDILVKHAEYMEKKRRQEEREQSTEYGQLLKNDPSELQRIMREEPERYDDLTKIHTLTTIGNG